MSDEVVTIEKIFAGIVRQKLKYTDNQCLDETPKEGLECMVEYYEEFLKEHGWQMTKDQKDKMSEVVKRCKERLNEHML